MYLTNSQEMYVHPTLHTLVSETLLKFMDITVFAVQSNFKPTQKYNSTQDLNQTLPDFSLHRH